MGKPAPSQGGLSDVRVIMMIVRVLVKELLYQRQRDGF
jgi:hypothetical protein